MVDSNNKETFVDAEKDADDDVASPDSKELENISKMVWIVWYLNFIFIDWKCFERDARTISGFLKNF